VESAEVLDARTITFRFAEPHAQAIEDFWWAPMPRHLLEGVGAAEMANAPFNRNPVGSGPFRFREWRANERLVLERNEDFPEALGGPPAAQRVVFRIVPEPATLLTELLTGGIHIHINAAAGPDRSGSRRRHLDSTRRRDQAVLHRVEQRAGAVRRRGCGGP
jgi:ABC-type transport system substrate-binding protein